MFSKLIDHMPQLACTTHSVHAQWVMPYETITKLWLLAIYWNNNNNKEIRSPDSLRDLMTI